jgi:hypothetical protein
MANGRQKILRSAGETITNPVQQSCDTAPRKAPTHSGADAGTSFLRPQSPCY